MCSSLRLVVAGWSGWLRCCGSPIRRSIRSCVLSLRRRCTRLCCPMPGDSGWGQRCWRRSNSGRPSGDRVSVGRYLPPQRRCSALLWSARLHRRRSRTGQAFGFRACGGVGHRSQLTAAIDKARQGVPRKRQRPDREDRTDGDHRLRQRPAGAVLRGGDAPDLPRPGGARWPGLLATSKPTASPSALPWTQRRRQPLPPREGWLYLLRDAEMDACSDDHAYDPMPDGEARSV